MGCNTSAPERKYQPSGPNTKVSPAEEHEEGAAAEEAAAAEAAAAEAAEAAAEADRLLGLLRSDDEVKKMSVRELKTYLISVLQKPMPANLTEKADLLEVVLAANREQSRISGKFAYQSKAGGMWSKEKLNQSISMQPSVPVDLLRPVDYTKTAFRDLPVRDLKQWIAHFRLVIPPGTVDKV